MSGGKLDGQLDGQITYNEQTVTVGGELQDVM